jgi:hypothetical protein
MMRKAAPLRSEEVVRLIAHVLSKYMGDFCSHAVESAQQEHKFVSRLC